MPSALVRARRGAGLSSPSSNRIIEVDPRKRVRLLQGIRHRSELSRIAAGIPRMGQPRSFHSRSCEYSEEARDLDWRGPRATPLARLVLVAVSPEAQTTPEDPHMSLARRA